jgi:anaerobic magnesium-protoporphyrin IX monomethyl ester cyclase
MHVVGGLIVGNPTDTRESIEANLRFARKYIDWPYVQHPTPYPETPMSQELRRRNLILHDRVEEYDGTTAVVRSEALPAEEIEFLRWKAERWLKLRIAPAVLRRDPARISRNDAEIAARPGKRAQILCAVSGLQARREEISVSAVSW